MVPTEVSPKNPAELKRMQAILGAAIATRSSRYAIHPGELSWWAYHNDPRTEEAVSYWLDGDRGFVVLDTNNQEISAFGVPDHSPISLIKWGQDQIGPEARVAWVSTADRALEADLEANGYQMAGISGPVFIRKVAGEQTTPASLPGFTLRPLSGEEEADSRRGASHAAFKSTMDPTQHLERYLRFMRSLSTRPNATWWR